jgi:hypothetical protein
LLFVRSRYILLFDRFSTSHLASMHAAHSNVLSCIDREGLEFELLEVRTRRPQLPRLRQLSREERATMARLVEHDLDIVAGPESGSGVALLDIKW